MPCEGIMTFDSSSFAGTRTATALVSSRDEEGTGQPSLLPSNFFLFFFPVQQAVETDDEIHRTVMPLENLKNHRAAREFSI